MPVRDNALAGDEFSEPHARLLETLRTHGGPGLGPFPISIGG